MVTEELAEAMNRTAGDYPPGGRRIQGGGSDRRLRAIGLNPPELAESPINLECRLLQILEFGEAPRINRFVIGEVLRVHVKNELLEGEIAKAERLKPIGRMGEDFYCRTRDIVRDEKAANTKKN